MSEANDSASHPDDAFVMDDTPRTWLGFDLRRVVRYPHADRQDIGGVRSASACISKRPDRMAGDPALGSTELFRDLETARAFAKSHEGGPWEILAFAYRGVAFESGGEIKLAPASVIFGDALGDAPPEGFALLGYDVVQFDRGLGFGCSPLTCNGMASEAEWGAGVNAHALYDSLHRAAEFGAWLGNVERVEPPPFYLVEVWSARP